MVAHEGSRVCLLSSCRFHPTGTSESCRSVDLGKQWVLNQHCNVLTSVIRAKWHIKPQAHATGKSLHPSEIYGRERSPQPRSIACDGLPTHKHLTGLLHTTLAGELTCTHSYSKITLFQERHETGVDNWFCRLPTPRPIHSGEICSMPCFDPV
jgi:hypothetical protein